VVLSAGSGPQRLAVRHLVETHGQMTLAQVLALPVDSWAPERRTSASYGFSPAPHWFRSEPLAVQAGVGEVLIEVGYPLLDRLELYVRTEGQGPWLSWALGDKLSFGERPLLTRNFVVPVRVRSGASLQVVARVSTSGSMRYPLTVWDRPAFEESEHRFLLANGIYMGLMGGLFLYHLIIFLIVRECIYLSCAGWILASAGFILSYNGLASQFLWPGAAGWNDWARVVFMLLASGCFTSFALQFLDDGGRPAGWRPGWPLAAVAVALLLASLLPFSWGARLALAIQLASLALCFALATVKARAGHVQARIFLLAFSGVMLGAVLLTREMYSPALHFEGLASLDLVPQLGSALAVVLFALALAHRLKEGGRNRFLAAERQRMNEALAASMQAEQDRARSLLERKEQLRLEAERRDRDKSRFLADAVHDLRQPLQAIGNALDPIASALRAGQPANAQALIGMATRAAATMRTQLSEILNLSRLESGLVEAELSDFDLAVLIAESVEQSRVGALASGTRIEFEVPAAGRPLFVRSDRHFLQRILLNLISNGVKYRSAAQGRTSCVKVALALDGAVARIAVIDNGMGMAQDLLRSGLIFRPFFQVNNRHAEADKGVGLGLSIVAAMLRLLAGHRMTLCSAVGEGSTFTVEVPVSPAAPGCGITALDDFDAEGAAAAAGRYVVLLEDDVLVRDTLAAVFSAHGVLYEAWGSIEEMQARLADIERAPDVLLSDYRLPAGRTALDAMRLMGERWGDVPTIILTGETLDPEAVLRLQGSSICHKPIAPLDLLRRIGASAARKAAPSSFGPL
jgi:signal transduction histidine kinase